MFKPAPTARVARLVVAGALALATVLAPAVAPWAAASPGKILFVRVDPATGLSVLYSVSPDGAALRQIFPGLRHGGLPAGLQTARWSPDGKRVAFTYTDSGLYVANADGTSPRRLASGDVRDLAWAPDSRRLVFARVGPSATERLYVVTLGGTARRLVSPPAHENASDPAWSPDGRSIVYVLAGVPTMQIWVVGPNGTGKRKVAAGRLLLTPDWSADSGWIGYRSFSGVAYDLYIVRRDGSGVRRLTRTSRVAYGPHWAPTGDALAYLVYVVDSPQVVVQPTRSAPAQRIEDDDSATHSPRFAWSPDATRLVFHREIAVSPADTEQGLYVKTIGVPGLTKILDGYGEPLDWR